MSDKESSIKTLKELNDLELQILFVDSVSKKMKAVLNHRDISTATLLFMYYSIVETLKKYKSVVEETKHSIPHEDIINLIISKGDSFLSDVSISEDKIPYSYKALEDNYTIVKDLMLMLKQELVSTDKYSDLVV
jgi:hypothetical protein